MNKRYFITVAEALALETMEDIADWKAEQEAEAAEREAARKAEEAEREALEKMDEEWAAETEIVLRDIWDKADPLEWDLYSDLYKDLHGVRPHWAVSHFFKE